MKKHVSDAIANTFLRFTIGPKHDTLSPFFIGEFDYRDDACAVAISNQY